MPGSSTSIFFNFKRAGYPGPSGGLKPFPGAITFTSVTTPFPSIFLWQGGGISEAEMPIGLTVHGRVIPGPTFTLVEIFTAATVGLVENGLLRSIFINSTSTSFLPLESLTLKVFTPSRTFTSATFTPPILTFTISSPSVWIVYSPAAGKLTPFHFIIQVLPWKLAR